MKNMNKQKQKNILIALFMFLLLVFVALICYILIYAKNNPVKTYKDPETIEIKDVTSQDYVFEGPEKYNPITSKETIKVTTEEGTEIKLVVEDNKLQASESEETIQILVEEIDVNNNIKSVFQRTEETLVLTNDGKLYRLLEDVITRDYILEATQILSDIYIEEILEVSRSVKSTYVLTNEGKAINVNNMEEYKGIYKTLESPEGKVTIYTDNSFSLGNDKVFVDEGGNIIRFNFWFNNILIAESNDIYEIDFSTMTLKTSKLESLLNISYAKQENQSYKIIIESTTGVYEYTSEYYYQR